MTQKTSNPKPLAASKRLPSVLTFDATDFLSANLPMLAKRYREGDPFPHIMLDEVFSEDIVDSLSAEVDNFRGEMENQTYNTVLKRRMSDIGRLGPTTRQFIEELHSPAFISFLEQLTGIEGLIPDPYLVGAGTHEIGKGGFLKVHTDFNWHKKLKLHRRINLLFYLNRDWKDEWKGHLELWDKTMRRMGAKLAPLSNRMVIFSTTDESYHGHPDILECPDNVSRKSIALYYYSSDRTFGETKFGKSPMTNWRARPGEALAVNPIRHAVSNVLLRLPMGRSVAKLLGKEL